MSITDEMVHVVVVSEFLKALHELSATEESKVKELDLLIVYKIVSGSVQHKGRCRI